VTVASVATVYSRNRSCRGHFHWTGPPEL